MGRQRKPSNWVDGLVGHIDKSAKARARDRGKSHLGRLVSYWSYKIFFSAILYAIAFAGLIWVLAGREH
jgi:hypothetical protein